MIKLIDINIEGDKHLQKVLSFLKKERPDIVCLQEVFQDDIPLFEKELKMKRYFSGMMYVRNKTLFCISPRGLMGVLILTKIVPTNFGNAYYVGSINNIPDFIDQYHNSNNRVIQWVEIIINQQKFTIANTHFTWSREGKTSSLQRKNLKKLFQILNQIEPCILCGDFNAPRGWEIYNSLIKRFKDNIPPEITTTIDADIHIAGDLQKVVDYIFSSPQYQVNDVKVIGGLSDHKAVMGMISNQ